jgi:hypothetical protein
VSRFNAKVRCNYYPLPLSEAERIRNLLRFPDEQFSALDPCVGEGLAFAVILKDAGARRYGIELDAYRAEQAAPSLTRIIQGNCLETHCPVESFSCIYLNPPYDWALAASTPERLEPVFLNHTFRWLIPGGVLLFVIPAERAADCAQILASHFKQVRTFRLPERPNRTRRASNNADRASAEQELGIGPGALEENLPRSFVLGRWPRQSKTIVLLEALILSGAIGPIPRDSSESRDRNAHPGERRACTRH